MWSNLYGNLTPREADHMKEKIATSQDLLSVLARRRHLGHKIVFTNGCFDLLHIGHVRSLQAARAHGDLLVVGLNSDSSVQNIKGIERPIVSEQQRAEVLAALSCVDHVVIFSEPEPLALITAIQPDILVKSQDWDPDAIVGRDVVEARGGSVVSPPVVSGISTTMLIERIRKSGT